MLLGWLRHTGHIRKIGITGSGADSLTMYNLTEIVLPDFPPDVQLPIATLYHAPATTYPAGLTAATFAAADAAFTQAAGIVQLDAAAKRLRAQLDAVLDAIARGQPVAPTFAFLAE